LDLNLVQRSNVKVADETLLVSGLLLEPGTFTTSSGETLTFTEDAIKKIYEKIDQNMPFVITHQGDLVIGYATKFSLDGGKIFYQGYVFDEKDKILKEGYDSVSGEFDVVKDGEKVTDGKLTRIAFVKYPAVPDADVSRTKEVKMAGEGDGDNIDVVAIVEEVFNEVAELEKPTPEEFITEIRKRLKKKGLDSVQTNVAMSVLKTMMKAPFLQVNAEGDRPTMQEWLNRVREKLKDKGLKSSDITKVIAVLRQMMKSPYPYPYPSAKAAEEAAQMEAQIEELREKLSQYQEKELDTLKNEVKELGLDPEKMVEGMDHEAGITLLRKVKESIAMQAPQTDSVKVGSKSVVQDVLRELGLEEEIEI